jgi:hypothetical protein
VKLREAMQKVWRSDEEWFRTEFPKAFDRFLLFLACGSVVVGPFAFATWFGFAYLPSTPWAAQIPLTIVTLVWGFFWLRVFSKWWPFDDC